MKSLLVGLIVAGGFLLLPKTSRAGDCCCAGCGCECQCQETCHLVEYMKKVTVVCYGCRCEDFCVPGPSCKGCLHDDKCESCPCGEQCGCGCDHRPDCHLVWRDWCPTDCAGIKTKKVLVRYEVVKEVPAYKWVVEPLCPACAERCNHEAAPSNAPTPPVPPAPPANAAKSAASDLPPVPAGAILPY